MALKRLFERSKATCSHAWIPSASILVWFSWRGNEEFTERRKKRDLNLLRGPLTALKVLRRLERETGNAGNHQSVGFNGWKWLKTILFFAITVCVLVPPITAFTSNSQSLLIYWLSVAHHPVTRDNPLPLTHRHSVRIFVPYFGWFHTTVLWGERQATNRDSTIEGARPVANFPTCFCQLSQIQWSPVPDQAP